MTAVLLALCVAAGLGALLCVVGFVKETVTGDWTSWPAPYAVGAVLLAFVSVLCGVLA